MKIIYVVANLIGGYAREDSDTIQIGGAYTDEARANIHRAVSGGIVVPVEIDTMPPGIFQSAKVFGLIK